MADAINARHGAGTAIAVEANISRKEALQHLVDKTNAAFGRIDVLVCNAASNPYYGPMARHRRRPVPQDPGQQHRQQPLADRHGGAADAARASDGSVIIVSSIGGLRGSPVIGAYCISKAADMQLARNLAVENGPDNIRVNCIAPGLIKTDFAKALWDNPDALERPQRRDAAAPHRRPRRDRRRSGLPGRPGQPLHDRAEPGDRRRRDDLMRR